MPFASLSSFSTPSLFYPGEQTPERQAGFALLGALTVLSDLAGVVLKPAGARMMRRSEVHAVTDAVIIGHERRLDGLVEITNTNSSWVVAIDMSPAKAGDVPDGAFIDAARAAGAAAILRLTSEAGWRADPEPLSGAPKLAILSLGRLSTLLTTFLNSGPLEDWQKKIVQHLLQLLGEDGLGVDRLTGLSKGWGALSQGLGRGEALAGDAMSEVTRDVLSLQAEAGRVMAGLLHREMDLGLRSATQREIDLTAWQKGLAGGKAVLSFGIEGLAAPILLSLDFAARSVALEMTLGAPRDRGAADQIGWLLGMLAESAGSYDLVLRSSAGSALTGITLEQVRAEPHLALEDGIASWETITVRRVDPLGASFHNRVKIIEAVCDLVPVFYEEIALHVRPWLPLPPPIVGRPSKVQMRRLEPADPARPVLRKRAAAAPAPLPAPASAPAQLPDPPEVILLGDSQAASEAPALPVGPAMAAAGLEDVGAVAPAQDPSLSAWPVEADVETAPAPLSPEARDIDAPGEEETELQATAVDVAAADPDQGAFLDQILADIDNEMPLT